MHEIIHVGGMSITFLHTRHETNDTFDAFELTIPPAASVVVPHTHHHYDEWVLGLNGVSTWTLNGEILLLHPGEDLAIPRGEPHFFANVHDTVARVFCLQTPGVMGPEYYRDIAAHYRVGEPDIAAIWGVMHQYGVEPLMPVKQIESSQPYNR